MIKDRQGNILSGATAETARLLDQAVAAFNIYRGDPIGLLDRAIAQAPGFAMAHIAKAHMCALSTEPAAMRAAVSLLDTAWSLRLTEREASHVAALAPVLQGEWNAAALALENHNARWPHDILAIQSGHLTDFLCADARGLRDRVARLLPRWPADMPGYSILLGMYAFGLEEAGDYARAEEMGRQAVALNPLDCWAHHAVAHVMEMEGRAQDGIGWMIAREDCWSGDDNFFRRHNWWHRALCHLDLGQNEEALALFDGPVRRDRSMVAMDMIDASALLWRLHLAGVDVGGRWQEIAAAWDEHADGRTSGFNDWHAAMAWLGAGRPDDVERLCAALRNAGYSETAEWGRRIALPLIEGFAAFWRGDHETAVSRLHGVRHVANSFGGSHAQRDIIDLTLIEAALRGGMTDVGEALAHERLALKPHSPVNRRFLMRARAPMPAGRKVA